MTATDPKLGPPYKSPPIEEALVEFRFASSMPWDPTLPGKLHAHAEVASNYTGQPRVQKFIEANVQGGPGGTNFAVREGAQRVQLVDDAGGHILSVGHNVLSISVLRPYAGWESFRPRVDAGLRAYVATSKAVDVVRVGVRYINKVVIPAADFQLGTYFRVAPQSLNGLPIQGFVARTEYKYEDGVRLVFTHTNMDAPQGSSAFLLDFDVIWESTVPRTVTDSMQIVEDLHGREGNAFEAVITDEARRVFHES